ASRPAPLSPHAQAPKDEGHGPDRGHQQAPDERNSNGGRPKPAAGNGPHSFTFSDRSTLKNLRRFVREAPADAEVALVVDADLFLTVEDVGLAPGLAVRGKSITIRGRDGSGPRPTVWLTHDGRKAPLVALLLQADRVTLKGVRVVISGDASPMTGVLL